MTYQEFIKQYGIHLYEGTELTPFMLANGWQWWSKQPYANEGLCRDKHTGNFYRYTTHAEKRNRLQAKLLKNKFTTQSGLVAGIVNLQWVYDEWHTRHSKDLGSKFSRAGCLLDECPDCFKLFAAFLVYLLYVFEALEDVC